MAVKNKVTTLGKDPTLNALIVWAEQNGFRVEFALIPRQPAQQSQKKAKKKNRMTHEEAEKFVKETAGSRPNWPD